MTVESTDQIAVVIPALNEASTIANLTRRALSHTHNVIIVDDASNDSTASMLSGMPVTVLRHAANQGKGASLVTGFREALKRDVYAVVTLDGDGQHRPEDIPKFLAEANRNQYKIVIGSRLANRAGTPLVRYCANRVADFWISWASGHLIEDSQCGFRLLPRQVLESVQARCDLRRGFVFESEFLINAGRAGYRTVSVPIPALYRSVVKRDSYFRPIADIARITVMVAGKLLSRWLYLEGLVQVYREWRDCGSGGHAERAVVDRPKGSSHGNDGENDGELDSSVLSRRVAFVGSLSDGSRVQSADDTSRGAGRRHT